jgi:hypothetical protein
VPTTGATKPGAADTGRRFSIGHWQAAVRVHRVRDGALDMPSAKLSRRLLARSSDDEARRALDWAEIAAMLGDYRDAVAWLDVAEQLLGGLPAELAARRPDWAALAS